MAHRQFLFRVVKEKIRMNRKFCRILCLVCGVCLLMSSCHSNRVGPSDHSDGVMNGKASQRDSADNPSNQPRQDSVATTIDISSYQKAIPPFKIRLVDGKGYTYKDLKKDKPLILVYFQPDCPECQAFTAALVKKLPSLTDKQIVMITFEDIKLVQAFDHKYQLSGHPNVRIGSEGYTFVVQKYYQIEHFPIVAVFDTKGQLKRIINPKLDPAAMIALL